MAKAFYILGNPPWAQGDVANASGEEAALIPPRKGGNADDELEGYRESAIAYLVRYAHNVALSLRAPEASIPSVSDT